ncbi:MAG: glycerol kinase GlpK [Nitrospinota bacterium]
MSSYILAIDQGTTSSRAILFDDKANKVSQSQREFTQHFPHDGWVEHEPEVIWQTTLEVCKGAIDSANITAKEVSAIGITNQRETTILWDRKTGKPIHNAIVWQDRRTADFCRSLTRQGSEPLIQSKTGLVVDPYFSASKVRWLLDNVPGARMKADNGELAFGTVDCFLLWRLTGGKRHATDATNASRTQLFNIHTQKWDDDLLKLFDVPASLLPKVLDSSDDFGTTDSELFGVEIPIAGIAGDQQAALVGQACFEPGMVKSTYGTGCFMIVNSGDRPIKSDNRLLTTVAYRIGGKVTYALEGSIFIAGAAIQWLRDGLKILKNAADSAKMAASLPDNGSVYMVPAFTGLGAPHWDPEARGAIVGLTRDSKREHIVRAALEAVCYQTLDLIEAMEKDGAMKPSVVRVDGGMINNDWLAQFLADILDAIVARPKITETTALGAAFLAGLKTGVFSSLSDISRLWQCERQFEPQMEDEEREGLTGGWHTAVNRIVH